MREYVVTKPNTGKHSVGDVLTLSDEKAQSLINKVELKKAVINSPELQALQDKNDELELTIMELREQLAEAKKPRRRGRKPKPEAEAEPQAMPDGV